MTHRQRRLLIAVILLLFFYWQRRILPPFFSAALAAYILSPLVELLEKKLNTGRTLSVLIIYLSFVLIAGTALYFTADRIFEEAKEFRSESGSIIFKARFQLSYLPDWVQSLVLDSVHSLQEFTKAIPSRILPFFTGAVSQAVNILIFLSVTFYLMKDAPAISTAVRTAYGQILPEKTHLLDKISAAFARYLETQLFLIILMSTVSFIALSILGVKFSLILGIFTGFAEIIPIIGPFFAAVLAAVVAFVDGTDRFGLTPLDEAVTVVLIYFILRQLEDLIVIPHLMNRVAKTHPILVMFAVLAGGHVAGIWGVFLAVPVLSAGRIILEEYW